MKSMDRRTLLASAAALGGAAVARTALAAAGPPVAPVHPVTEDFFGTKVTDRYRWMEDPKNAEFKPWLLSQNDYARKRLAAIPGRDKLAADISKVSGAVPIVSAIQAAGPYIFIQLRPAGANTYKLYVREGLTGANRLLIDPDTMATATTHYSLDYWQPSPDGKYVAYGTSPAGSEDSVLYVLETATGAKLPEAIDRAQSASPSWLPDNSGMFINRLKEGTKHGDPDHYLDSINWLHQLKAPTSSDVKVFAKGLDPAVQMQDIDFPIVNAQVGSDIVIGAVARGVQNEIELYASPLAAAQAGKPVWTKVCSTEDAVTGAALWKDDLYLLTHKDASRFRIVKAKTSAPTFAQAVEVVPQSGAVIKGLVAAKDGVYVQLLDAGIGKVFRLAPDGSRSALKLPFEGAVSGLFADPLQDGCWFAMEGWVRPTVICRAAPDGAITLTDISPKPAIDVSAYASREVMVPARDGAKVPLSIVYRKDVKRDGTAPLYLQAYGSYAIDIDPAFNPRLLAWLDRGGVFAVAHVRGGGELGEDWHKAGQKLTKPNTWHDCIDCAKWLIANKWTSSRKLAVEGTSAGGIMISRFLTEEPSLLKVAVIRVGDSDAMRAEFMESGPANIPEFGTVKEPDGFKGLYEMDGYQHVKDGTAYPAALVTTGLTDPRVANWEAGKIAARLQAASSSGKPVLLRVETDAGHGIGSTRKQRDDETADTYAFILWQTGDPRYQPKA
jgi:prolyl oligopeptidase